MQSLQLSRLVAVGKADLLRAQDLISAVERYNKKQQLGDSSFLTAALQQ